MLPLLDAARWAEILLVLPLQTLRCTLCVGREFMQLTRKVLQDPSWRAQNADDIRMVGWTEGATVLHSCDLDAGQFCLSTTHCVYKTPNRLRVHALAGPDRAAAEHTVAHVGCMALLDGQLATVIFGGDSWRLTVSSLLLTVAENN